MSKLTPQERATRGIKKRLARELHELLCRCASEFDSHLKDEVGVNRMNDRFLIVKEFLYECLQAETKEVLTCLDKVSTKYAHPTAVPIIWVMPSQLVSLIVECNDGKLTEKQAAKWLADEEHLGDIREEIWDNGKDLDDALIAAYERSQKNRVMKNKKSVHQQKKELIMNARKAKP